MATQRLRLDPRRANELRRRVAESATPDAFAAAASHGRWKPARHLRLLSRYLTDLSRRAIRHLIVTMPPRHGKSTMVSHYFPAWYLGNFPEHEIILTSYGGDFAAEWGAKSRAVMEEFGPYYFGQDVLRSRKATDKWKLANGRGSMFTTGARGTITGKGANLLIVDDPIKNIEEAESVVYREKTYSTFISTAYSRLEPGGVVVVMMTRWHEDDLVGRLIADMSRGGVQWTVLNLPALAEEHEAPYPYSMGRKPGEALWSARYPVERLEELKLVEGPRHWSSLYQGRPVPIGGGLFKPAWFKIHDGCPKFVRMIRFWDLASTEEYGGRDPDWTAGALWGMDNEGRYWLLDMRHVREHPAVVEEVIKQTAALDGRHVRIAIEQEGGASGKALMHYYATKILPGYAVFPQSASGSKVVRATQLSAQAAAGNVHLLNGPWVRAFLDEIAVFPAGTHDDQVDAASGGFNLIYHGVRSSGAVAGSRAPHVMNWIPHGAMRYDPTPQGSFR